MALDKKAAFYTLGCKVNQYETERGRKWRHWVLVGRVYAVWCDR